MDTMILTSDEDGIKKAGMFLREGELVGIPTETVYGLAADAQNHDAVAKIFEAKGRPADNPLIVHVNSWDMFLECVDIKLSDDILETAQRLAGLFWPGPLTMVVPKNSNIPPITSGNLDTVGVRMPAHPLAQKIIESAGCALAAPSANTSGSPSPTEAEHVLSDMNGKISAILDGGACPVGIESTVVAIEGNNVLRILRPGYITRNDFLAAGFFAQTDPAVDGIVSDGAQIRSPGMKYRHYSPQAEVILVEGNTENFCAYVNKLKCNGGSVDSKRILALGFSSEASCLPAGSMTYGDTAAEQAKNIFSCLRLADKGGAQALCIHIPTDIDKDGVDAAVQNRLLRAAGFKVVKV